MPLLINGELVEDTQVREEAGRIRGPMAQAMPETDQLLLGLKAWEWARENVIERVLLRQAAGSEGVEALVARITAKVARPSGKETAAYYREHRESFLTPEQVHAAHIVKNTDERTDAEAALAAIAAALAELRAGRRFQETADAHSDCPGNGGDLGWIVRGVMVEEFEAVVFGLRVGECSEIFRSPFGFHIAKVWGRKPAGVRSLNEVRADIERAIHGQRKEKAVEDFVDGLRARADIRKVAREA